MARQIPIAIAELLNLPVAIKGVSSALTPLFEQVKLIEPGPETGDLPLTDAETQAIRDWFDSIGTWLGQTIPATDVLPIPTVLQNVVAFDPDQQRLTLQINNATERKTSLAGMAGLSFVIPVQSIEVIARLTNNGVQVTLPLNLALRLNGDTFGPMRSAAGGRFEPDPSRTHTDIDLVGVTVEIDSTGGVTFPTPLLVQLLQPVRLMAAANLLIESAGLFLDLSGASRFLVIRWETTQLAEWLGRLAPNFESQGGDRAVVITLRLGLGDPLESVRLDWAFVGNRQNYRLPGIAITTPADSQYTVLLKGEGGGTLNRFLFILTLPAAANSGNADAQLLSASSTFAWTRSQPQQRPQRELQSNSDPNARSDADPLFKADFVPVNTVSLALLDWTLTEPGLPSFLQQVPGGLAALDFDDPVSLQQGSAVDLASLSASDWEVNPSFNTEAFDFPFLRNDQRDQRIQLELGTPTLSLAETRIGLEATVQVRIGSLLLNSAFDFNFNWETFALTVEHGDGLQMLSAEEEIIPDKPYLGLNWRFKGAPALDEDGQVIEGRFHHLTLVTKDFNYQVVQAPGAEIEVSYAGASEDPISFIVSNLAITDTGITLSAEVSDRPAKLNGLDTRFRFHGSRLDIVDNKIQDFTLAGSGPLPPDLVGEATADIALQFSQQDGALTLVSGAANLRGNQLLKCQGTRFEFSIDGMGLKFVNDGKFHLYFTLTGTAQFLPLPTDNPNGPLALLAGVQIKLVECPLTSDVSVIGQHVEFLIELPEKVSFSFLGCFEMEIRSIGFVPQFAEFGGDAAMEIGGQVKFAQGTGDVNTVQIDFHSLFIGLPAKGSFLPRLYMEELEVNISLGEAFKLNAAVEFRNNESEQGFLGEGVMEIPGMPVFAASFAFLRVRRSETEPWVRAWFIFVEARQVSLYIPVVELYIREIGLGFGYRYTISSIKAADEENNLSQLIGNLRELSRTQGDLSKRDRWAVDLEDPGESLRWTIVLRALISQTSATPGAISLKWLEQVERTLPCLFLFDAIIAFRSDLTFFMAVRAWINTNYYDFVNDDSLRERPLFSGFVLLSVRQQRFLAQISSNPNGSTGTRPPLPLFVEQAILNGQFAATILIEPGLLHAELGWPNMLRWGQKIGPLEAEVSGGMIFRVTKHYLVLGISYKARGSLSFEAGLNLKIVGVRVSAHASFAWGARFIGLIDFAEPATKSALYVAIGLEMRIRVSIALWIKFLFVKKTFRFSLTINFTAGLELGIDGLTRAGLRGSGTLMVEAMGRSLQVSVKLGINEGAVKTALDRTAPFLDLGLEASDVEPVPGVGGAAPQALSASAQSAPAARALTTEAVPAVAAAPTAAEVVPAPATPSLTSIQAARVNVNGLSPREIPGKFNQPQYDLFVIRPSEDDPWGYFVLLPRAEVDGDAVEDLGFLPVPPDGSQVVTNDFELTLPSLPDGFTLQHFRPLANPDQASDRWQTVASASPLEWRVDWDAAIEEASAHTEDGQSASAEGISLGEYLAFAFKTLEINDQDVPVEDPDAIAPRQESVADGRVDNPSEGAYEAAVRGALEQFRSSPFFKHDPNSPYDRTLEVAFRDSTSIYTRTGESASGETGPTEDEALQAEENANQLAHQMRGLIVQDLVADLQDYAELPDLPNGSDPQEDLPKDGNFVDRSIAFQMGLVFRYQGTAPDWLDRANATDALVLKQRTDRLSTTPNSPELNVRTFNMRTAGFAANPPQFEQVQPLTDTNTIAISWNLTWNQPPEEGCSECQGNPNHHLLHYRVRRRALNGDEPEAVYTVKPAAGACFEASFQVTDAVIETLKSQQILAADSGLETSLRDLPETLGADAFIAALRDQLPPSTHALLEDNQHELLQAAASTDGVLKQLQPRFQLVDHFTDETVEDQAAMPATGLSYLYSITPVDFTKAAGRPLTLVATRYPSEPPRVPVNGEFKVEYQLSPDDWSLAGEPDQPVVPEVVVPSKISATWSDPVALRDGPNVPVAQYRLIFRKDSTLPIGSYGLDSSTQGPRSKNLPTTNARALPTDIKIRLQPPGEDQTTSPEERDTTTQALVAGVADPVAIPLMDALQQAGIFPQSGALQWRPESWRIFLQTESVNGVPSALAPVKLLLRFTTGSSNPPGLEERQPAQLEWLPKLLRLPMLPPEDSRLISDLAHVPMPKLSDFLFNGSLSDVSYRIHPAQLRLLRLRWNQGPSDQPQYPLNLNAGYTLLELDVDAHTNQTFRSTARLADALREIQQVQLLPAEDLTFTPKDTLTANQWEAWYPSRVRRLEDPVISSNTSVPEDQPRQSPWYSWRESHLIWPDWPTLSASEQREEALHPFLQALVDTLSENPRGYITGETLEDQKPLTTYNVNVQFGPPRLPGNLAAFQALTAPKADPYGWSILLRLGLSMGLSLRDERTNDLITGDALLLALQTAINALEADDPNLIDELTLADWRSHLHVELLFQPGQSFSPEEKDASPEALLAVVQLSLRPKVQQYLDYAMVKIQGPGRSQVEIELKLNGATTLIDQSGVAGAQDLPPDGQSLDQPIIQPLILPLNGQTRLLLRYPEDQAPVISRIRFPLSKQIDVPEALKDAGFELITNGNYLNIDSATVLKTLQRSLNDREKQDLRQELVNALTSDGSLLTAQDEVEINRLFEQMEKSIEPIEQPNLIGRLHFSLSRQITVPAVLANVGFILTTDDNDGTQLTIDAITALGAFQQSLSLSDTAKQQLRQELIDALASGGASLTAQDALQVDAILNLNVEALEEFSPRDQKSTYFRMPASLADDVANPSSERGQQWQRLKLLLESINSTDTSLPAISVPTSADAIAEILPDFVDWSQRFFDAAADDAGADDTNASGPWLVTAYPRISTPAYASPDASGRLKYDHLLSDRWAHNYRYYIRPSSRYDLLWQSLLESPELFPPTAPRPLQDLDTFVVSARTLSDLEGKLPQTVVTALETLENQRFIGQGRLLAAVETAVANAELDSLSADQTEVLLAAVEDFRYVLPDPNAGGLDVTVDRTQPIDKPLVLSSGRLDAPSTPSNPAPPGRTWEVMVAQHLEQRLVQRNQTLVRRLAYRQIAFTLLRRFAYSDWPKQLKAASTPDDYQLELEIAEEVYPEVPSTYPDQADHIDLDIPLSEADARSLDLPLRNGNFQQGAMVLQWDALPFFYEHRLLLIAQSATTVSAPNEIVQRDFEYLTPEPEGTVENIVAQFNSEDIRTRRVELPLKRFWDALSADVQAQWDSDNPDLANAPADGSIIKRKPASLPDPEVIYQIVELYSGNLDVQVEYFFDPEAGAFALRQLGQRFLGELKLLQPPTVEEPQADFVLKTCLHQVQELQLEREAYFSGDPIISLGKTENKVQLRKAPSLFLVGVFNRQDRVNLLINSVPELQALSLFPGPAAELPLQEDFLDEWYSTREFADPPITPTDLTVAVAVPESDPVRLDEIADYPEVPTPDTIPAELRAKFTIGSNHQVTWQGTILSTEETSLKNYRASLPNFQSPAKVAIDAVLNQLRTVRVSATYDLPVLRPHPEDLLPNKQGLEREVQDELEKFVVEVTFPNGADPGSWTLSWTGPMGTAAENHLKKQAANYEATYKEALEALVAEVQLTSFETRNSINNNGSQVPSVPQNLRSKLSIEIRRVSVFNTNLTYIWRGSMTDDEIVQLRDFQQGIREPDIRNGIDELIRQAESDPNRNQEFTERIDFAWPRPDQLLTQGQRQAVIGNDLAGLSVDESQRRLRWTGANNLGVSVSELVALVGAALRPEDPFVSAFAVLMPQLDRSYSSFMLLKLLRLRSLPSLAQEAALRQVFSNQAIDQLLADLRDRAAVDQLYNAGFSQQPISEPVSIPGSLPDTSPETLDTLRELIDFPDTTETVLVWQGEISPAEREASLSLSGDDAFTTAIEQLTRRRPANEELPEEIRTQLLITEDSDAGEQLTWTLPFPTNEQIQLLQGLVVDAGYATAVRQLVQALLENPTTTKAVSVPLAPLPALQQLSIPPPPSTRPTTANLPDVLQGKLLIGNAVIRYHGLMTTEEGIALRDLYSSPSDKAAIERLFQASTQQGRELRLQARRGSAAPSALITLTPQSLPQD